MLREDVSGIAEENGFPVRVLLGVLALYELFELAECWHCIYKEYEEISREYAIHYFGPQLAGFGDVGGRFLRKGVQAKYAVLFGVGIEVHFLLGHWDSSLREFVKLPWDSIFQLYALDVDRLELWGQRMKLFVKEKRLGTGVLSDRGDRELLW